MVVEDSAPLIVGLTFKRTSQSFQGRPFWISVTSATSEGPAAALSTPFCVYRSLLTLQSPFPGQFLVGKDLPIVLSHDPALGVNPLPSITVTLLYARNLSTPQKRTRKKSVALSLRSPSLSINGTSSFAIKVNELSSDHDGLPFVIKFSTIENHDICPCYTPAFYSVMTEAHPPTNSAKRQRSEEPLPGPAPELSESENFDFDELYSAGLLGELYPPQSERLLSEIHDMCARIWARVSSPVSG
jgi:hypothetical protein